MRSWTQLTSCLVLALSTAVTIVDARATASAPKVVLTNDDGWAVAQIRAQRDALVAAGFNVRTPPARHFLLLNQKRMLVGGALRPGGE